MRARAEASRTRAAISAPEYPSHAVEVTIDDISSYVALSIGVRFVWVLRTSNRSEGEGRSTYKSLSSRPGRTIAGSIMSGLLVAPIT